MLLARARLLMLPVAFFCGFAAGAAPVAASPQIGFTSLIGGAAEDSVRDVAIAPDGNLIVAGGSASPDFPVTPGAYDTTLDTSGSLTHDAVVAKLDPNGNVLWATYVGGPEYDRAYAVEVDALGFVYIGGRAGAGFPVSPQAAQQAFLGGKSPRYGEQDAFVAKLSPDGAQLLWATYLGSDDEDVLRDIDIDADGAVYGVMDRTQGIWSHISPNAFQPAPVGGDDGIVLKLSATGSVVEWATYLGGSGDEAGTPSIRATGDGDAVVLGMTNSSDFPVTAGAFDTSFNGEFDMFVTRVRSGGASLAYSTFLGGSETEFSETHGLALDPLGRAVVAGTTKSLDLPVSPGAFQTSYGGTGGNGTGRNTNYPGDGFVTVLSADGSAIVASTYLGASRGEGVEGVGFASGLISVTGATYSDDFPTTLDALQPAKAANADLFISHLSPDLTTLVYSTFVGGDGIDLGRSAAALGAYTVVGGASSSDVLSVGVPQVPDPAGDGAVVLLLPEPAPGVLASFALTTLLGLRALRRSPLRG